MRINKLAKEIHANSKEKGFWNKERNIGEMLMLTVGELSEAMEAHRRGEYFFRKITITEKPEFEEWRDIKEYKNEYQISNYGRVRSLNMKVFSGRVYYEKQGRMLKPGLGGTGYYTVALRGKSFKIARLVAAAFIDNPNKYNVVNHINGNKTDDYETNLEWGTFSMNNIHALKSGLSTRNSILSKWDLAEVFIMIKNNITAKEIAKKYNVTESAIKSVKRQYRNNLFSYFEYEIADAIIRLLDLSEGLGIDIEKHIELKMKYNKLREYLHGKKY